MSTTWTLVRRVEPEWLDSLRPDDPRAMRSRDDLRRVNAWMLQSAVMARLLLKNCGSTRPRTLLDLGAGDGTFMLQVARRLVRQWPAVSVILLDRQNVVNPDTLRDFRALGWQARAVTADVFDFLRPPDRMDVDVITANLFLHHFAQDRLRHLLALAAQRTRLFVACEPRRSALALLGSRLLWAIGCNDVTRHDAAISVGAGFHDRELSALWPNRDAWRLRERRAMLFTHCLVAQRPGRVTP